MSKSLDAIVPAALIAIGSIAIVLAGSVPPLAAPKSTPAVQPSPAQPSPTPAAAQRLGIGREATAAEIAGWDIDVRPDGQGLPAGKGTVKQGEPLYMERCAACHGEFGESAALADPDGGSRGIGEQRSGQVDRLGLAYASTVMDYIRRSMPFGNGNR